MMNVLHPWQALLFGLALAACATPAPPRPAMQPLSVAGNFGYSERNTDADTIEVTYRGAAVQISSRAPRSDSRVIAEKEKVHDLALLRAARIAQARGFPALRIVGEKASSDIDVQSYPRCRVAPFWGAPGFWGHGYPYGYGYRHGYGWSDDYICYETRWAKVRATAVLTVDLVSSPAPTDQVLSVQDTITRLETIYAGATYR